MTPAGSSNPINHVLFMMRENHSFDNFFGMLNPYRRAKGWNVGDDGHVYTVDGIDDKLNTSLKTDEGTSIPLFKLKSTCIDDASSTWVESYGDVSRYNFLTTRPILMDGFVHNAATLRGLQRAALHPGNVPASSPILPACAPWGTTMRAS